MYNILFTYALKVYHCKLKKKYSDRIYFINIKEYFNKKKHTLLNNSLLVNFSLLFYFIETMLKKYCLNNKANWKASHLKLV